MRIKFYADWSLALIYLIPLYDYIKLKQPTWDLYFATTHTDVYPLLANYKISHIESDIAIVCDELSVCADKFKICIFHGLASKGQAFFTNRKNDFCNFDGLFAVPSDYYKTKLLNLGVSDSKIFISGLSKLNVFTKNILFAPTHNEYISAIPVIQNRIYELDNVKVHLHMYTRTDVHTHHKKFKEYYNTHEDREDIVDLLKWCDILIGDFGSIILEGIALGKQTYQVVNPDWTKFYTETKQLTENEMLSLPEVELPKIFSVRVDSFDELKYKLNLVCKLGDSCQLIYERILNVTKNR